MVKRFVAVGAAFIVALFSSTVAFAADTTSNINIGFPYFSRVNLRQGNTYIYQGINSNMPISSVTADATSSTTVYNNILLDFMLRGSFTKSVSSGSTSISYKVPVVSGINLDADQSSLTGLIQHRSRTFYYDSSTGSGSMSSQRDDVTIDTTDYTGTFTSTDKQYTVTIPSSTETVNVGNDGIDPGEYFISGYFDYPYGTFTNSTSPFDNSVLVARVPGGGNNPSEIEVSDYSYSMVSSNTYDRIYFRLVLSIPYAITGSYSFQLFWNGISGADASISRFSVSTGCYNLDDSVNGIAGFTYTLGSWISGLKNGVSAGFNRISSLLERQDDEHEQVASQGDSSGNSDAQSKIADIESYEADLNTQIDLSVQSIDFTVPSSYGGALSAVGYIFTSVFNAIGGYQVVLTIPLILGIMLLLVGRGSISIGKFYSRK